MEAENKNARAMALIMLVCAPEPGKLTKDAVLLCKSCGVSYKEDACDTLTETFDHLLKNGDLRPLQFAADAIIEQFHLSQMLESGNLSETEVEELLDAVGTVQEYALSIAEDAKIPAIDLLLLAEAADKIRLESEREQEDLTRE